MDFRDPFSSYSHLITAAWAFYATLLLLRICPKGDGRRLAVAVYGMSMVVLYIASGVFHGLQFGDDPTGKDHFRFFQKLDQSAIFLVIAGTNTPVIVFVLMGGWRRWCLRVMWGFASLGVGSLWLLPKAPHWSIVGICLGMGWLGFLPFAQYYRALGWRGMNWIWIGALTYSTGAICELTSWPTICTEPTRIGSHEVFHVFTALGSMAFFIFIIRYVVTYEPPEVRPERPSAERLSRSGLTRLSLGSATIPIPGSVCRKT